MPTTLHRCVLRAPVCLEVSGSKSLEVQRLKNGLGFYPSTKAGSLARLGHPLDMQKVAGTPPAQATKRPFTNSIVEDLFHHAIRLLAKATP